MGEDNKRGFFETVFNGVVEEVANRINKRLHEEAPRIADWLMDKAVEKAKGFLSNHKKLNVKQLLIERNNRLYLW